MWFAICLANRALTGPAAAVVPPSRVSSRALALEGIFPNLASCPPFVNTMASVIFERLPNRMQGSLLDSACRTNQHSILACILSGADAGFLCGRCDRGSWGNRGDCESLFP